jgi:8-oxo-dGTP diphosphatase
MTKPVLLVVAAALFDSAGRVLLAQRPEGKQLAGLWEFPGGKLEAGESPEAALVRELEEELSVKVNESALEPLTFASFAYPGFHLLMPLYGCKKWSGLIQPREGQAVVWVETSRLRDYPAPPADLPLFDWLAQLP